MTAMKQFFALFLTVMLSVMAVGVGAQDGTMEDNVVADYLNNFDETLLADDAVVYDDAYAVTYDDVDMYTDNAPFYQDWWQDVEVTVENIEQTVENQFRTAFNINLPDIEEPVAVEGFFHVDEEGMIDDIDYYYDETIFADTYDYEPVGVEGFTLDFNQEMVERLEDNPTEYYGESVTVRGNVETILDSRSFILQDMEPFDLTPAEFLVVAGDENMFSIDNTNINVGQTVVVTGVLRQIEFADLTEEIGWDADDSVLGIFSNDTDEFQLIASNVEITDEADSTLTNAVENTFGENESELEDAADEEVDMSAVSSDYFGLDRETAELVEDNPEVFYGQTVTIQGVIENIVADGVGLRVQNRELFDFTPPTFLVMDVDENVYADMDLEEGDEVEITGMLQPFERLDWTAPQAGGEFPGWDIDDSIIRDWVEDTDEFLMFADALTVTEQD